MTQIDALEYAQWVLAGKHICHVCGALVGKGYRAHCNRHGTSTYTSEHGSTIYSDVCCSHLCGWGSDADFEWD